jgi:tricarballylate dehydrogenase
VKLLVGQALVVRSGKGGTMPEYDVIVVGAGNAALAAAVSAREQGARRVVVLEKAPPELRGGNTHYSGGLFRFAFDQAEDLRPLVPDAEQHIKGFMTGVQPYPDALFRADLMRVTEGRTDPELSEILIGRSYDTIRWVADQGIVMEPAVSLFLRVRRDGGRALPRELSGRHRAHVGGRLAGANAAEA